MPVYAGDIDDKTIGLIDARIGSIETFVNTAQSAITSAVGMLGSLNVSGADITLDLDALPSAPTAVSGILPPTPPALGTLELPTEPSESVSLPSISAPSIPDVGLADEEGVAVTWAWTEEAYVSNVLETLINNFESGVVAGTGISESLQALLIANYFNKIEEMYSEERTKVQDYFSSRSLDSPAGVLASQTARLDNKYSRMRQEAVRDTTAEVLKLEHEYVRHCQLGLSKIEEFKMAFANSVRDRALLGEKTKWELIISAYTKGLEKMTLLAQYARLTLDAEIAYADGMAKIALATSEIVKSRWEGYKAHVQAITDGYTAEMEGFVAQAGAYTGYNNAAASMNNAAGAIYEAQSQVAISAAGMAMKAQEASIASILKASEVLSNAQQALGSIGAQTFAAAMNSVNLGATINAGYNASDSNVSSTSASTGLNYNLDGVAGTVPTLPLP